MALEGTTAGLWRGAWAEHGAALHSFLASRVRRREDAEDLLQETFVRAIRAGAELRDHSKVRSYLFSIAHRLVLDHYRRRREQLFADQDASFVEGLAARHDPTQRSPETPLIERELDANLARALRALPDALRQAFQLAVVERLPYLEIAARTGWSLSLVKVNVYRARKRLIADLARVMPELGRLS